MIDAGQRLAWLQIQLFIYDPSRSGLCLNLQVFSCFTPTSRPQQSTACSSHVPAGPCLQAWHLLFLWPEPLFCSSPWMTSHPLNLLSAVISSEKSFLPTLDSHLHPSCPVSTPCFPPKSSLRFFHLSIDLCCFSLLQREGSQGLVPCHLRGTLIHHNAWCTVGHHWLCFWLGGWM